MSTVSRVLKKALVHACPFSPNCEDCPLPECAIKEPYAQYVNNTENVNSIRRARTKPDGGQAVKRVPFLVYQDRTKIAQHMKNKGD